MESQDAGSMTLDTLLRQAGRLDAPEGAVDELVAVKLWQNPCWFSFRINFLALQFNVPIYRWIEVEFGLQRVEFVVLYSLNLKNGVTASAICNSSGFPRNTISRAIQKLIDKNIVRREVDSGDLRSFVLHLTDEGKRIVDAAMRPMQEREQMMLAGLSPAEQLMLSELLAKVVADSRKWPESWPANKKSNQETDIPEEMEEA